mmetsp:Transcript_17817/g.19849  ORF Transcript_17817/g.19849 Transcript_17817/m.19849 type:complete len:193 (-) Transcript_17817:55-633(-)
MVKDTVKTWYAKRCPDFQTKSVFLGLCSLNVLHLVVRLTFGCISTTYLIHSIVIFIDLLLASILCINPHFHVALNTIVAASILGYMFTRMAVFEYLETTLMAVFASIYGFVLRYQKSKIPDRESRDRHFISYVLKEFLDGSSGVMYTSFMGLVIAETLNAFDDEGSTTYIYCNFFTKPISDAIPCINGTHYA